MSYKRKEKVEEGGRWKGDEEEEMRGKREQRRREGREVGGEGWRKERRGREEGKKTRRVSYKTVL